MRRALSIVVVSALASGARGDVAPIDAATVATPDVVDALTGIDFVAQKPALDVLFGTTAVDDLSAIADAGTAVDPSLRLRALRALALYPTDPARASLTDAIAKRASATAGIDVLELRAAIEALGVIGQPADVATIVPLLDKEGSRDVRAAAARALRDIGSPTAIAPLHARLAKETSDQVRFWISDALRVLSGTPP